MSTLSLQPYLVVPEFEVSREVRSDRLFRFAAHRQTNGAESAVRCECAGHRDVFGPNCGIQATPAMPAITEPWKGTAAAIRADEPHSEMSQP